jgi:hypothetical protein
MAMMTASELATYAPTFTGDGGAVAILNAQTSIESMLGYDLEQQERIEILKLTRKSRTAQLSFYPIAASPTPVFEVREGNINDSFDREIPLTDWYTLASTEYVLDSTGLITLNVTDTSLLFGRGTGKPNYLRATYTAGLDFTANTTEIQKLKASLGQIVTYQQSQAFTQGLTEVDIDGSYKVKWGTGRQSPIAGNVPEQLFGSFKRYQQRNLLLFS